MMQQVRHQYEADQLRKARDKSNSVSNLRLVLKSSVNVCKVEKEAPSQIECHLLVQVVLVQKFM